MKTLHKGNGFSLAEIILAVGLMGIIIILIAGVFVQGLSAIKKGRYKIAGLNIAERKLSEIRKLPLGENIVLKNTLSSTIYGTTSIDGDITWGTGSLPVEIKGQEMLNNLLYDYVIRAEEYTGDPGVSNIKKITINVNWKEPGAGNKSATTVTLVARPTRN